ncbi:MAG: endo-1,4-beta-xylanase, partial [Planctomycetota bacterium]|nr:endo-1,4-beta-xylanase [Planctomycetota bacterium]
MRMTARKHARPPFRHWMPVAIPVCCVALFSRLDSQVVEAGEPGPRKTGLSLLPAEGVRAFRLWGRCSADAAMSVAAVEGAPFRDAIRIVARKKPAESWEIQAGTETTGPVRKGDRIRLVFFARAPAVADASGKGRVEIVVQKSSAPWTRIFARTFDFGKNWERFEIEFEAKEEFAAGGGQVAVSLGFGPQTVEIGGLEAANLSAEPPRHRVLLETADPSLKDLPDGAPLAPGEWEDWKRWGEGWKDAEMEKVAVAGQPFPDAVRVRTKRRAPNHWDVQLGAPTGAPMRRGDACLAVFRLRLVETPPDSNEGMVRFGVQEHGGKYEHVADMQAPPAGGRGWQTFFMAFSPKRDFPAGKASVWFDFGDAQQVVEVGGVAVVNFGSSVAISRLPNSPPSYSGMDPRAQWRADAAERIEKLRKGDMTVIVLDAADVPVAGASVEARQVRHAFRFGTAVASQWLYEGPETDDRKRYREELKKLFDAAVIENDAKPQGMYDGKARRRALECARWLKENGFRCRGHCLVWPAWQ